MSDDDRNVPGPRDDSDRTGATGGGPVTTEAPAGPQRRLSKRRAALAATLAVGVVAATVVGVGNVTSADDNRPEPWFAGYVDVTLTPTYAFETPVSPAARDVVLGFVVADPGAACTPSWGGAYSLDAASTATDVDRRISRLRQAGGDVVVSFGGLKNDELSTVCEDEDALVDAYRTVVDRYDVTTIDLDVEGKGLTDEKAAARRAAAVKRLQDDARGDDRDLAVWLTLPVSPSGLTDEGFDAVEQMITAGVDLAGVNAMTMNYATSREPGESMRTATESALNQLHRQLDAAYRRADKSLSAATLWGKIGATPMIGQNDERADRFELEDAEWLGGLALERGLGRLSMWSLNRDNPCGPNYVNLSVVSNQCSGSPQAPGDFAKALDVLEGSPADSASRVTTEEPTRASDVVDDPATSPYAIWSEEKSYPAGTKVVWRRNVYQSKWWAQGEVPDAPVVHEWETPWELVGPVLPGETPVPTPTFKAGTYPAWAPSKVYERGDRVMHETLAYEAKWYSRGDVPGADVRSPGDTPWELVTP